MQEKLNIAVFVDYDNIEIGLKSTLRREFDVSLALDALKERGDIVAKFAYANWGRQDGATRQMAENAVQMVQRIPSPRGDKNGADINLALDALEMAFTHTHVNAFAIVSGDSDFIPLVNKLKEYGKTVFVVGGKAFTSTILQQNCHEFISFESLLSDASGALHRCRARSSRAASAAPAQRSAGCDRQRRIARDRGPERGDRGGPPRSVPRRSIWRRPCRWWNALCKCWNAARVQPQLGLLKSTMLQLDSAFNERAYGASSFSDFVEKLKRADLVNVSGTGGRYIIERKGSAAAGASHAQARRPAAAAARRAGKSSPGNRKWLPGGRSGRLVQDRAAQLRSQRLRLPGVHRVPELRAGQDRGSPGAARRAGHAGVSGRGILSARRAAAARARSRCRRRGKKTSRSLTSKASRPSSSRIRRRPSRRGLPSAQARAESPREAAVASAVRRAARRPTELNEHRANLSAIASPRRADRIRPRCAPAISSSSAARVPSIRSTDKLSPGDIQHETRSGAVEYPDGFWTACGATHGRRRQVLGVPEGRRASSPR